jgi:hypothetical protein
MWAVIGLAVGPCFAVLGRWIRVDPWRRSPALAVLGGVLIGEGTELVWYVGVDDLWPAGIAEMTIGGLFGLAAVALAGRDRPVHRAPAHRLLTLACGGIAGVVTLASIHAIGGGGL